MAPKVLLERPFRIDPMGWDSAMNRHQRTGMPMAILSTHGDWGAGLPVCPGVGDSTSQMRLAAGFTEPEEQGSIAALFMAAIHVRGRPEL